MLSRCVRKFLAMALFASAASADAADLASVHWFTLSVDGVRSGYAREERSVGAHEVLERETVTFYVRQLGRRSRLERSVAFRHSNEGVPIAFDYELANGTVQTRWQGTFTDGALHIRQSAPKSAMTTVFALPPETAYTPDRGIRFAALWKKQLPAESLLVFDPARRSSGLVRAQIVGDGAAEPVDQHVRATFGTAKDAVGEDIWFDMDGNLQRVEAPLFGAQVTWTPCAQDCDARVAAPVDLMDHLVVRSPVRIPAWYKHRTLRYVITRSDGARPLVATTSEQAAVFDASHAVLTICAACGNDEHPSDAELARYLAANAWVQSDDPEIRHLALNTVARVTPVDLRMRKLARLVIQRMRGSNDFLGYGDAVGALHTGNGDCTEFAVLLAALARAQGIPTRIAVGLAYSGRFSGKKDVFSPHAWVQSWDGKKWTSYDAALDGFDSTHIALAVGNGEPDDVNKLMQQLPLLRIEKAGVVRDN